MNIALRCKIQENFVNLKVFFDVKSHAGRDNPGLGGPFLDVPDIFFCDGDALSAGFFITEGPRFDIEGEVSAPAYIAFSEDFFKNGGTCENETVGIVRFAHNT